MLCPQVSFGDLIRDAVGAYNKTKVFNLPLSNENVLDAIRRSKAKFSEADVIPTSPQTAVHRVIVDLVAQGVIKVPK
jgi:hypothetical protein